MSYNCPKCSSKFEKGTKFCQTCGCNLELEYIENPVCPKCKTSYPTNTKFCLNDGSKLVRQQDLIPKCVICNTSYSDDIKFCPRDGGEVKIVLTRQFSQPAYGQTQSYQKFGTNQKYPKASLGNRFLAALLDGLILLGLSIPAIIFFALGMAKADSYDNKDGAIGLFFITVLFYTIPLIYNFIKDGLGQGQSWGKKALDLMVVNLDNNGSCDKGKSFFRNFISWLVAIIPFVGWLIEPNMVLATEDGRKLGDKAANTQVIDKNNFQNKIIWTVYAVIHQTKKEQNSARIVELDLTYTPSNDSTNSKSSDTLLAIYIGVAFLFSIIDFVFIMLLSLWDFIWVVRILQPLILILIPLSIKNKTLKIIGLIIAIIIVVYKIFMRWEYYF